MKKLTPLDIEIMSLSKSAEMFPLPIRKLEGELVLETFQQSTPLRSNSGNVEEASPPLLASPGASHPELKEKSQRPEKKSLENNGRGRKLKLDDLLLDIGCALSNIRSGARYQRMTAYFSIRTDQDVRYAIFLRSNLTTAMDEIIRNIRATDNKPLLDIAKDYINSKDKTLMLGRLRYTAIGGYVTEQHRYNLKHGLFATWMEGDQLVGELYLNGEYYPFIFHRDLTEEQTKSNYCALAKYNRDQDKECEE